MTLTEYYKRISAKGKAAIAQKKAEGESMHQAPLGYINVREDGRMVLQPDPATWYLIEQARELRRQGYTLREICWLMERKGLRSKRGKIISLSGMDKILKRGYPSTSSLKSSRFSSETS